MSQVVCLCDVIKRAQTKVDKDNTDLIYYVGGEHFESEKLTVAKKGFIKGSTIGPMFYYGFKKGDFLLVSRNPHLKKAGRVDFDGICSEKTFVLESADPAVLYPYFLPFILQNERFWEYAQRNKHGSTNFFLNWEALASYKFELPDLDIQRKLSNILWAINNTIEAYKNLISATDELVKSQFIEMFGQIDDVRDFDRKQWKSVLKIISGKDHKKVTSKVGKYPVYGTGGLMGKVDEYLCPENTIVVGRKGTIDKPYLLNGKSWIVDTAYGIVPNEGVLNSVYLLWYCKQLNFYKLNKASTLPSTTKGDLLDLWINVPPYELQERFAKFVQQSDKSKFELQQALTGLTATYKRIIAENIG